MLREFGKDIRENKITQDRKDKFRSTIKKWSLRKKENRQQIQTKTDLGQKTHCKLKLNEQRNWQSVLFKKEGFEEKKDT